LEIDVQHLTKRFGNTVAVDDISFSVDKGEVVGFLGPNGAGKTTTMRILTCFMPATNGNAKVAGHDVFTESLDVRRNVGYMPEGMAIYPEMRVKEYLRFRAGLKGIGRRDRKERVAEVMDRCGIADVERKLVGYLSKGYRQRVGLAEALIHDPPILILDEPTIGLDPNQIRQVRQLISDLGEDHTVLLSTHILSEVEMVCGRVIIINRGKVVLQDTPDNVAKQRMGGGSVVLEVRGPGKAVQAALETVAGVDAVHWDGKEPVGRFTVTPRRGTDVREDLFRRIAKNEWALREMRHEMISLEEIFAELTAAES